MTKPVPLQYGLTYHIYNRGNNRETIFLSERNYRYFLRLYADHVLPIADTYAYCLLPNHFHFLLQVKEGTDLTSVKQPEVADLSGLKTPSQYFSNLFNAYAKAFNKAHDRSGSLFQRPFGRVPVTSDVYFVWLITYIHQNPQKHGIVDDFRTWSYSSFQAMLSTQSTRLKRDTVLEWFDGVARFADFREQQVPEGRVAPLVPEDFD